MWQNKSARRSSINTSTGVERLEQAFDSRLSAKVGRKNHLAAGVFRRDEALSPNWEVIDDSSHVPVNINSVALAEAGAVLSVDHKTGAVASVLAVTDETFAMDGVTLGVSGGGGTSNIKMGAPCNYEISLPDGTIKVNETYFDPSRFSYSMDSVGDVTLGYPASKSNHAPVLQHTVTSLTGKPLDIHYIRSDLGFATSFFFAGDAVGKVNWSGSAWELTESIWDASELTFTWDDATKTLTIDHPTVFGATVPMVASNRAEADINLSVHTATASSFSVAFENINGEVVNLGADVAFSFSRGKAVEKNPTGKLLVDIGRVQVLPSQVNSAAGNIWFLALNSNE